VLTDGLELVTVRKVLGEVTRESAYRSALHWHHAKTAARFWQRVSIVSLALLLAGPLAVPRVVAWLDSEWHPPTSSESDTYRVATQGKFSSIPYRRHVRLVKAPLDLIDASKAIPAGWYDVTDRSITVVNNGNLGDSVMFAHKLRHEYGHAFVHDYLRARHGITGGLVVMSLLQRLGPHATLPKEMSDELAPLYREYRDSPALFGPYASTSFGEWLAEAYVAYVANSKLPPSTERFMRRAAAMQGGYTACRRCH